MADFDIRLLCEEENYNEYYYRNSDKEEIDLILDRKLDVIPIEVKYTNQIEKSDTIALKKFLEKNKENKIAKATYGLVITKDIYKKEENIFFVPYWMLKF